MKWNELLLDFFIIKWCLTFYLFNHKVLKWTKIVKNIRHSFFKDFNHIKFAEISDSVPQRFFVPYEIVATTLRGLLIVFVGFKDVKTTTKINNEMKHWPCGMGAWWNLIILTIFVFNRCEWCNIFSNFGTFLLCHIICLLKVLKVQP